MCIRDRRNHVRYQQQRGEAAGGEAGLAAQHQRYIARGGSDAPGPEGDYEDAAHGVRASISIAQGVSGGSFWSAVMK